MGPDQAQLRCHLSSRPLDRVLSDAGNGPEAQADILLKEGRFNGTKDREVVAQNMADHLVMQRGIVAIMA